MAFFFGSEFQGVELYYHHGDPSDESWGRYLALVETHAKLARNTSALTIACVMSGPSAKQRKALATTVNAHAGLAHLRRHAFVTDSKFIFGVNTAINWLAKKAFEERCYLDPTTALQWLQPPNGLLEHLRANVPPAHQWLRLFGPTKS